MNNKLIELRKMLGMTVIVEIPRSYNYALGYDIEITSYGVLCGIRAYYMENEKLVDRIDIVLDSDTIENISIDTKIYPATPMGKAIYGD